MDQSSAKRNLVLGGILFAVGLMITVSSLSAGADGGGGRYVVSGAAMILGAARFIYGLVRLRASKRS